MYEFLKNKENLMWMGGNSLEWNYSCKICIYKYSFNLKKFSTVKKYWNQTIQTIKKNLI